MANESVIKLFEGKKVRVVWDEEMEKYYFAVQDIVQVLTDSADIKQYVKRLRSRDKELDSVWGTICTPPPICIYRWEKTCCELFGFTGYFPYYSVDSVEESGGEIAV